MLKAGGRTVVQWLYKIIDLTWRSGSVPMDWQKALIVPIHKKGSRTKCENYHGISLLSIPGKVYDASILETRMRTITEGKVLEEQGAFQKGRSCVDQLFTVRQLGEKIFEKNKRMLSVINATVMPTLLYVCETWTLLERHKSKVQAFEMRCLRRVEGVTILDKVRNEDIRSRLGQLAVVSRVEKKTEWLRKREE